MVRVLLTGATGTLGRELRPRLLEDGYGVRAVSRSPPATGEGRTEWMQADLATGEGLIEALAGVDVVIHAATAPLGDTEAVDVLGTARIVDYARGEGIEHLIYVSIVGIDAIPLSYYEHKRRAERLIEDGSVPWTVLRSTQFHSLFGELLGRLRPLPCWPLPRRFRLQPIDAGEVADRIVRLIDDGPAGRPLPVGGPEVRTLGELTRTWLAVRGWRRAVVPLPLPGRVAAGFREGAATVSERAVGTTTWREWVERAHGPSVASARSATSGGRP